MTLQEDIISEITAGAEGAGEQGIIGRALEKVIEILREILATLFSPFKAVLNCFSGTPPPEPPTPPPPPPEPSGITTGSIIFIAAVCAILISGFAIDIYVRRQLKKDEDKNPEEPEPEDIEEEEPEPDAVLDDFSHITAGVNEGKTPENEDTTEPENQPEEEEQKTDSKKEGLEPEEPEPEEDSEEWDYMGE